MKRLLLLLFFLPQLGLHASTPADPGIYAIFKTNHGEITVRLFFEEAPMTVANFVGLAEGSRSFIDPAIGGLVRRPFYDGLIFHRVISGFMIQGGCPLGQGTSGPGYVFWDELSTDLIHNRPGILSMANSGAHTNGSQFFITTTETPWLDAKHSVFGEVIAGMEVVNAISDVPTDEDDRPLTPVTIEAIEIVRNGTAAQAFEVGQQALPKIEMARPRLSGAEGLRLHFPRARYREDILFYSNDLQTWTRADVPFSYETPAAQWLDVSGLADGSDRQFYRTTTVDYGFVRTDLVGQRISIQSVNQPLHFVIDIEGHGGGPENGPYGTGTFSVHGSDPLPLVEYVWIQDRQRGRFGFRLEGYVWFEAEVRFVTETSGTVTGTAYTQNPVPFFGTFSLESL